MSTSAWIMFASASTDPELFGRVLYCKSALTGTKKSPPKIPVREYNTTSANGCTKNGTRNMHTDTPIIPIGIKPVSIKSRDLVAAMTDPTIKPTIVKAR